MPVECSKLTCFAKVKIRHGSRAVRSTIEVGRCQSSFAYCEAEFDLGKGKNRSKATYPHWKTKTITIIDVSEFTRVRVGESKWSRRSVARHVCVDLAPVHNYGSSAGRHSADLLAVWGPSAGLKHSVATSSGWLSNDPRPLRHACTNDSACRRRSERSKEQEDLRSARPRACVRQG